MPFSRRNVEKLGISLPPPDAEPDDSGLGFLRDDFGSATTDGDFDPSEQPRTQSVLSLLSWGDDEFERQSTREVQQMLEDMDRLLYEGETSDAMAPTLADECQLWSKRFPHLRVLGRHIKVLPSRPADRAVVRVALLTEDGPVDEETAACLREPGHPETICSDGPESSSTPEPNDDRPGPGSGGGGGGGSGSAEPVQDPATLIAEMVTNSLVSQLWADYVHTMTPVFQLGAESAENMKLTSVSREASARNRRHSDPGRAPPPPPPPPQPPPRQPPRQSPSRQPPQQQPPVPAPRRAPAQGTAATAAGAGTGTGTGARKTAAAGRGRSPSDRLPAVRPRGGPSAASSEQGAAPRLAANSRATLPRISPSTETTRQVAPQAPPWSRHQNKREPRSRSEPTTSTTSTAATAGRTKPQQTGKIWDSVSRDGAHRHGAAGSRR